MTYRFKSARNATWLVALFGGTTIVTAAEPMPEQLEFFENKIRPILAEHCYKCHSTRSKKLKGGLYLDNREQAFKGGESGPSIAPGQADSSLLYRAILYKEESLEMPPTRKLPDAVIADFKKWIDMGAPWPISNEPQIAKKQGINFEKHRKEHWSLKPINKPTPPDIADSAWPRNPVDHFVLARLEKAGITPAPEANRRVLIRRAYFDLIGLPPTPEVVAAFVAEDTSWDQIIEELLASPQYGERWARHWMDIARYSDGLGGFLDNRALPNAWQYRDFVVNALNDDVPFDQFIRWQIAGELTPNAPLSARAGTGFFAVGPTYNGDGGDAEATAAARAETLSDRVDTFSRAFLGLTVACARCHDHKFDPISIKDYYAIAGIFNNTSIADKPLVPDEIVKAYDNHQNKIKNVDNQIKKLNEKVKKEKREISNQEKKQLDEWKQERDALRKIAPPKYATAHGLHEKGNDNMHVAIRGDLRKKGEEVPRRFLQVISREKSFSKESGLLQLAEAVVARDNPLTPRVLVNRIWQWHFGRPIVRTPSNFGVIGEKPTHPLLLDWLATNFTDNEWSIKDLHRLIMKSATYRMSSRHISDNFDRDGENRLIWRMNPRRVEVESWRDSMLAATGELDLKLGGTPTNEILNSARRSIYATISRNGDRISSDPFFRLFGFPAPRSTAPKRIISTVPQQYLFIMNSPFFQKRADALAKRLTRESETNKSRIEHAYQILFNRQPSTNERDTGLTFLAQSNSRSAWNQYTQALLGSEEFRYIE
ncbi:MAG: DUF1553 domain-containing protein [Verrucomicrobiota bacterium]|nr:DUF1553 domain-containing protein [Verrucomicrobiota bacterium]